MHKPNISKISDTSTYNKNPIPEFEPANRNAEDDRRVFPFTDRDINDPTHGSGVFLKPRLRTKDFYPDKTTPVVAFATRIARSSRGGLIESELFHGNLLPLAVSNFAGEKTQCKNRYLSGQSNLIFLR